MARKYQIEASNGAVMEAPVDLPFVGFPIAALSFPSNVKVIHSPRRRLLVTFYYDHSVPVKMRQTRPNLGNSFGGIQSAKDRRV